MLTSIDKMDMTMKNYIQKSLFSLLYLSSSQQISVANEVEDIQC